MGPGGPARPQLGRCETSPAARLYRKLACAGGRTYDAHAHAYAHAKEAIRVAIRIAKGEKIDCPENICLAKGRLVTQQNVNTIENLWSRPAQ